MRANLKTQRLFLKLVDEGLFIVKKSGKIKNTKTKKVYTRVCNTGYISVAVKIKGKKYQIQAHRLIWLVHKGWLKSWEQINHKNGVKTFNRLSNLEKTNNSGNSQHAYNTNLNSGKLVSKGLKRFHKRNPNAKLLISGENNGVAVLTNKQARCIRKYWKTGEYTKTSLAEFYGVSRMTIRKVVNGSSYRNM